MRDLVQRLLRRGPKYGIARGVAVLYSPGGVDTRSLATTLGPSPEFAHWIAGQGMTLDDSPASLVLVEDHLDGWSASEQGPALGNEVGLYLGRVLVHHRPGAAWAVWPNGHPVVRLPSGRDIDVIDIVGRRLLTGAPILPSVYLEMTRQ